MIHLRSISLARSARDRNVSFPFSIPALEKLEELTFTSPVTFFVGENGSGKSTLLEALARATQSIAAGTESVDRDPSLEHVEPLARALRTVWNRRTRRGFF